MKPYHHGSTFSFDLRSPVIYAELFVSYGRPIARAPFLQIWFMPTTWRLRWRRLDSKTGERSTAVGPFYVREYPARGEWGWFWPVSAHSENPR